MISKSSINGIDIVTVESKALIVSMAPALGGKITRLYNKQLQKEFLWSNNNLPLTRQESGADYDTNFWGGIDELLPNDLPETIDGVLYPDHGELWTTALHCDLSDAAITVHGALPLSGLYYRKTVTADADAPVVQLDYEIKNETPEVRHFLWKLHAALQIAPGDQLVTPARFGRVVDPAYSRFNTTHEFKWPLIENTDASRIPPQSDAMDFFYLYETAQGVMQLVHQDKVFRYTYDKKVFPYQWYFASYGGFLNHYTAILEPCTNMPISVNDAVQQNQCATLAPGEAITTSVQIYAGSKNEAT